MLSVKVNLGKVGPALLSNFFFRVSNQLQDDDERSCRGCEPVPVPPCRNQSDELAILLDVVRRARPWRRQSERVICPRSLRRRSARGFRDDLHGFEVPGPRIEEQPLAVRRPARMLRRIRRLRLEAVVARTGWGTARRRRWSRPFPFACTRHVAIRRKDGAHRIRATSDVRTVAIRLASRFEPSSSAAMSMPFIVTLYSSVSSGDHDSGMSTSPSAASSSGTGLVGCRLRPATRCRGLRRDWTERQGARCQESRWDSDCCCRGVGSCRVVRRSSP